MAASRMIFLARLLLLAMVAAGDAVLYDVVSGEDLTVNQAGTSHVAVARFSATVSVACYANWGQSGAGTCKALSANGSTLSDGEGLVVNENDTYHLSVASVSETSGVVCFRDQGGSGLVKCVSLGLSGQSLTKVSEVVVNAAATSVDYLAVARLRMSPATAIVCYRNTNASTYGAGVCAPLPLSSMTLGADLVVNEGSTTHFSIATLSDTRSVVCYADGATSLSGTCTALAFDGTALSVVNGAHLTVSSGEAKHISAARFSSTALIVCFSDVSNAQFGACSRLTLNGDLLDKVANLTVNDAFTEDVSVAGFSETEAVMCFSSGNSTKVGLCSAVSVSGANLLNSGNSLPFNNAQPVFVSVAHLSESTGLVCYRDAGNQDYGTCNALEVAEVTTTSSTETSSTTQTATVTSSTTGTATSVLTTTTNTTGSTQTSGTETSGTRTSTTTPHTVTTTEVSVTVTATTLTDYTPPDSQDSNGAQSGTRIGLLAFLGALVAVVAGGRGR